MRKLRTAVLCAIGAALACSLMGCAVNGGGSSSPSDSASSQSTSEAGSAQDRSGAESEEGDAVAVETPQGTLFFPVQWSRSISVDQEIQGDVTTVTFTAQVDEGSCALYTVSIGAGEGDPVGVITDQAGVTRDVYVRLGSVEEMQLRDTQTQDRLYAMQESVNYVIEHLK